MSAAVRIEKTEQLADSSAGCSACRAVTGFWLAVREDTRVARSLTSRVAVVCCAFGALLAPAQGRAAEAEPNRLVQGFTSTVAPIGEQSPTLRRMAWLACRVRHPDTYHLLCDAPIYREPSTALVDRRQATVGRAATDLSPGSTAPGQANE